MEKIVLVIVCLLMLVCAGCSTTSTFTTRPEGAQVAIAKTGILGTAPTTGKVPRTTFGKYPLKIEKEGLEPLYAILPLSVSGGVIALDVLLFAPAAFFNVQGSFDFYEFDLEKRLIRYKNKPEDDWKEYMIPEAEKKNAMQFYGK